MMCVLRSNCSASVRNKALIHIQLSNTRAHFKGVNKIMAYHEAALLLIKKKLQNLSWNSRLDAL